MMSVMVLVALAAAPAEPKLFALVVGNNQAAEKTTPDLRYADDDALALHELLLEAGVRSLLLVRPDAETSAMHANASALAPTAETLALAWKQLQAELRAARDSGQAVEFLFFFSGHGDVSHGEGFLALEGGRLTRSELQAMLAASPGRRNHVIIDACKAYFAVLGKGAGGTRAPYPGSFALKEGAPERTGFLLSSSSDRDSHEWERYQAGVFSFEVRSALRGSADVDGDGVVTYRELGGFLTRANEGVTNPRLRPDFLVAPPGGAGGIDEPLLRWPSSSVALELDGDPRHVYVEGVSGKRLLESNRGSARSFLLHLPRERPLFVRNADEREERVLQSIERTSFSSMPVSQPDVARKGALALALSALFSQPFDESAVQAFAVASSITAPEPPAWKRTLRVASPIVAGTATVAGLVSLGVALERSQVTDLTSQAERVSRNQAITSANVAMGISAGVTAAAIGLWIFSWTGEPAQPKVELSVSPNAISVSGRW